MGVCVCVGGVLSPPQCQDSHSFPPKSCHSVVPTRCPISAGFVSLELLLVCVWVQSWSWASWGDRLFQQPPHRGLNLRLRGSTCPGETLCFMLCGMGGAGGKRAEQYGGGVSRTCTPTPSPFLSPWARRLPAYLHFSEPALLWNVLEQVSPPPTPHSRKFGSRTLEHLAGVGKSLSLVTPLAVPFATETGREGGS